MALYRLIPRIVNAHPYAPGMEDGFTDDEDHLPYLKVVGVRVYVQPGDIIVTEMDGLRYPLPPDEFAQLYAPYDEPADVGC